MPFQINYVDGFLGWGKKRQKTPLVEHHHHYYNYMPATTETTYYSVDPYTREATPLSVDTMSATDPLIGGFSHQLNRYIAPDQHTQWLTLPAGGQTQYRTLNWPSAGATVPVSEVPRQEWATPATYYANPVPAFSQAPLTTSGSTVLYHPQPQVHSQAVVLADPLPSVSIKTEQPSLPAYQSVVVTQPLPSTNIKTEQSSLPAPAPQ